MTTPMRFISLAAKAACNLRKLASTALGILILGALSQSAQAQSSVTLAWNPSASSSVVGYRLYQGIGSQTYTNKITAGNATSLTVSGLKSGVTYYFAATAYDANNVESPYSNEITYTAPAATAPPTVALTSPANGASFTAPASITCAASVTANGQTISKVQFYNGTTLLGEDSSAPYSFTWGNVAAGSYSLSAKAVYGTGSTVASSAATVNVAATSLPPTVALASPTSGASFSAPAAISCAANVTANGHTITKVQFYNGTALLGEDLSAPYSFAWNNVSAGTYSLSARAVYDSGSTVASAAATVNVAAVTNTLPSVALTSPANGASFSSPATVNCAASVTANGHTITKVQFFNGTTLLGEASSAPYSFAWSNVAAGTYSVSARAVYDSGSTVASTAASVSVAGTLPAPWKTMDIGSVGAAGSVTNLGSVFTLNGAGNISGTADSFRYVYQPMSGDGGIRVSLKAPQTATNGVVGVMIRESLTSGSRFVFMGFTPNSGYKWQGRSITDYTTFSKVVGTVTPPNAYVRLIREGDWFYGYYSTDGVNWIQASSLYKAFVSNPYIGLVVASGSSTDLNAATVNLVTVVP